MTCLSCEKTKSSSNSVSSKIELINNSNNAIEKVAVIYRSDDLDKTWISFANGIPEEATLSSIKQDGIALYVATDYHGFYTTSGGRNSWSQVKANDLRGLDINCLEIEGDMMVVGTLENGILVSKNKGKNWTSAKKNIQSPVRAFLKLENKIYAGTDSGIFESADFGDTWYCVERCMLLLNMVCLC